MASKLTRFQAPAFTIFLMVTAAFAQRQWISFSPSTSLSSERTVAAGNVHVENDNGVSRCILPLTIPGVALDYPDDNGLLGGTYATFAFKSEDIKVSALNFSGTIDPDKRGMPDLPLVRLQVRIPYNAQVEGVSTENTDYLPVEGEYAVAPIQEQLPESFVYGVDMDARVFTRDDAIYSRHAQFTYPISFENMFCHTIRFLEITYCPITYNPQTKKLYATNTADIVIKYRRGKTDEKDAPGLFSRAINSVTFNGTGVPDPTVYPAADAKKFIVVSKSSLINTATFEDYIAFRQSKGYTLVEIVNADGMNASGITSRIQNLYASSRMDYVIIVGDETIIPIPVDGTSYHYKTWSRLNGTDNIEDVGLGIFLCDNETKLKNIVQHQKWHEAGGAWSMTQLSTSGAEVKNGVWDRFSTGHHGTVHLDDPSGPLNYTVHRVYQVPSIPTRYGGSNIGLPIVPFESWTLDPNPFYTSGSAATAEIIKRWNEGVLNISHRDHGSTGGTGSPPMRYTMFSNGQITSTCSPFFTSLNCLTGNFKGHHTNNLAYLAQTSQYGTCTSIGATVTTYSGDNDGLHEAMYTAMYPKSAGTMPVTNIGQIWLVGHLKGKSHSRTYFHVYGDPMTNLANGQGGAPFISLISPNGGETIETGSIFSIVWGDNIPGNVRIDLIKGASTVKTLAASVASNGTYQWTVGPDITEGSDYKIKVTSVDSAALYDQSNSTFGIIPEYVINRFPFTENCDTLDSSSTELPYKWEQSETNQLPWVVWAGPTPSRVGSTPDVTGPTGDHTSGKGNYIYMEASGNSNEAGEFITPKFDLTGLVDPLLSFWCHMFCDTNIAGAMGSFYLDINVDGVWSDSVVTLSGDHGDRWFQQVVDLNAYKGTRVVFRFRGKTGNLWASDICLDDFAVAASGTRVAKARQDLAPNSFDLQTSGSKMVFRVPASTHVAILLFDLKGQLIQRLFNGRAASGIHALPLEKGNGKIACGTYLCRMETHRFTKTVAVVVGR
ncbi:MAG: hypothetical protein JXA71_14155 [Chitinispirillaceae bacterium]|nr:hypothetical protein [Chitinispirillaceae bacterium]